MVELGWTPKEFLECSPHHLGAALKHWYRKENTEYYNRLMEQKRLAYSIAEVFCGDPKKIEGYYDYNPTPLSSIEEKVGELNKHFKKRI